MAAPNNHEAHLRGFLFAEALFSPRISPVSAVPSCMDRTSFENLVNKALRRLPRPFKQKLENISIQIQDHPSTETLDEMGIKAGTLLGLYQGVPLTERGWGYGNVLPDQIVIYQRPIEERSSSLEEREEMVLEVVMHEIGHYFGFDDRTLYGIEAEKSRKKNRR